VMEEAEKALLIHLATAACKASTDCISAVKICLSRTSAKQQFVTQVPVRANSNTATFPSGTFL
jgi:son of sevenless